MIVIHSLIIGTLRQKTKKKTKQQQQTTKKQNKTKKTQTLRFSKGKHTTHFFRPYSTTLYTSILVLIAEMSIYMFILCDIKSMRQEDIPVVDLPTRVCLECIGFI